MFSSKPSSSNLQQKTNDNKDYNLCPFKLLWSFGINSMVPVINLTTENRTIIAYACSHTVMIYNYRSKELINLQGHQNAVNAISISMDGKWLVSADFGKDSVVVVWDTETGVPICTLFNPHGDYEVTAAKISQNAKYIVTVGNEIHQNVHFWLWTFGKDKPDGIMELTEFSSDRVKDIAFNEDHPEEFVLTAEHHVVFCNWKNDQLECYYPQILGGTRRYGAFNCSCFVGKTYRVVTATTYGYVMLWNVVDEDTESSYGHPDENRKHIKSVHLHKCDISALLYYDGFIVIGTGEGRICFYDNDLKILYSCGNPNLDSIKSIGFELTSSLIAPMAVDEKFKLEFSEENIVEYEEEFEQTSENELEDFICDEKKEHLKKLESISFDKVLSTISVNLETPLKNHNKGKEKFRKVIVPTDTTIDGSLNGSIALIDIPRLKCHFIFQNQDGPITSLDAHPRSGFIVTGNVHGIICLYNYETRKTILRRKSPPMPDSRLLCEEQMKYGDVIYTTCGQIPEEASTTISILKYSPFGDMILCGVECGALWMLHPITLEPLDQLPYRHSTEAIQKLIFTECGEYMAYSDKTQVVAVFRRNRVSMKKYLWNFLGKCRAHDGPVRDLLFGPVTSTDDVPLLFSVGEDRNLIEYNLKNSGPYPDPGLQIFEIYQIEYTAVPQCLGWYPVLEVEKFLMISNSEYKYRLLNNVTKKIRGTFLGPLFGSPVQYFKVLPVKELKGGGYMLFVTEKEIGIQIYPFDGNPYKILGIIGHPRKITNIAVNYDSTILFTSGHDDPCVLMWKIKCRSVDVLAHLGGEGLSPYYCLIEGGRDGWLIKEMRDLFYYAQILHQGENTIFTRIVTEKVPTKQIPNLMCAVGFYPSNREIEICMEEISYRNYANTGHLVEEITFEDFVKLYVNHRPAFGISLGEIREAFQVLIDPHRDWVDEEETPVMTREQFVNTLYGIGPPGFTREGNRHFGEPMTPFQGFIYLKVLFDTNDNMENLQQNEDRQNTGMEYSFLQEKISYKDFIADIMGIELKEEETRADDN